MSSRPPTMDRETAGEPDWSAPGAALIIAAYEGDLTRVHEAIIYGAGVDYIDPATGLTALHIAVGTNDLALCRLLIEQCGAAIRPDRSGRWPTVIAAQCQADAALSEYILWKEEASIRTLPS